MINPFNPRYPIEPKFFVGRKEILDGLKKGFAYSLSSKPPRPENVAITGAWGIGKTSILNKFCEEISSQAKVLPIFISLTTYNDFSSFARDLINKIHRTTEESKAISGRTKDELFSWRIKSLKLGPVTMEKDIKEFTGLSGAEQLRSSLIDLWKSHLKEEVDLVVLMLDDFHHVVKVAKESLYDIRSVFQELPRYGCNYKLVIPGTPEMFGKIRDLAEPLVRFFEKYELKPFSYEETKEEINLPLTLQR